MRHKASVIGLSLVLACTAAFALDQVLLAQGSAALAQAGAGADNTSVNTRDRAGSAPTPQTQSNASADRELLAAVRRTVVKDKSLSTSAHNVKIVVADGGVTLRGPVRSDDEKARVEALTRRVAGVYRVDNQLDVQHN